MKFTLLATAKIRLMKYDISKSQVGEIRANLKNVVVSVRRDIGIECHSRTCIQGGMRGKILARICRPLTDSLARRSINFSVEEGL